MNAESRREIINFAHHVLLALTDKRHCAIPLSIGAVTRYNLAYINHSIFTGDNGRVVGFDNKHGFHHRHTMGVVEKIDFVSYQEIEQRFEDEWLALRGEVR